MGYGVIGNTKVSGSFVLGSSPGIPANLHLEVAAPSYSGLVLRPLTAATPVQIRLGSPLGKSLGSSEPGLFCLSLIRQRSLDLRCRSDGRGRQSFSKKLVPQFDLPSNRRYSLIRKRDWRSGSALRSHRRGHWFEPSITHQRTPVSRNGGFIVSTPAAPSATAPQDPADRSVAPPRERQPRHGPTTNEVPP